jgi:hypothetical protein
MNHWKWSNGDPYYKSARKREEKINNNNENNNNYDSALNAINLSLYDENTDTKREQLDGKLSNRELVFQRGTNPFLKNSYVDDIIVRDMFLKPINTTQGKIKEENEN